MKIHKVLQWSLAENTRGTQKNIENNRALSRTKTNNNKKKNTRSIKKWNVPSHLSVLRRDDLSVNSKEEPKQKTLSRAVALSLGFLLHARPTVQYATHVCKLAQSKTRYLEY